MGVESSATPHRLECIRTKDISTNFMEYESNIKLDKAMVKTCEAAWQKIASTTQYAPGTRLIALFAFCETFFTTMTDLDADEVVVPLFKPRSVSSLPHRNALLLKIVRYMLSIPNDKFSSKSKIRKLGRAHARRQIRERHFKVFAEAFMRSLVSVGGKLLKDETKRYWCQLLNFFVNELAFENVSFMSHRSTSPLSDANLSELYMDLEATSNASLGDNDLNVASFSNAGSFPRDQTRERDEDKDQPPRKLLLSSVRDNSGDEEDDNVRIGIINPSGGGETVQGGRCSKDMGMEIVDIEDRCSHSVA
jgi:hemoglobin-like flavoprotein